MALCPGNCASDNKHGRKGFSTWLPMKEAFLHLVYGILRRGDRSCSSAHLCHSLPQTQKVRGSGTLEQAGGVKQRGYPTYRVNKRQATACWVTSASQTVVDAIKVGGHLGELYPWLGSTSR
jgi:hypothetical protein